MLDWTEKLHPRVLDLYLYSFDGSLHVQPGILMGQAFATWPWFRLTSILFYIGLPIPIALVYSGQLLRRQERALPTMLAFLLTGPLGILFYNLFPALGPAHLLNQMFPWRLINGFFWISPLIPWILCTGTIALVILCRRRLDREVSSTFARAPALEPALTPVPEDAST
jgi:hypothetical protein